MENASSYSTDSEAPSYSEGSGGFENEENFPRNIFLIPVNSSKTRRIQLYSLVTTAMIIIILLFFIITMIFFLAIILYSGESIDSKDSKIPSGPMYRQITTKNGKIIYQGITEAPEINEEKLSVLTFNNNDTTLSSFISFFPSNTHTDEGKQYEVKLLEYCCKEDNKERRTISFSSNEEFYSINPNCKEQGEITIHIYDFSEYLVREEIKNTWEEKKYTSGKCPKGKYLEVEIINIIEIPPTFICTGNCKKGDFGTFTRINEDEIEQELQKIQDKIGVDIDRDSFLRKLRNNFEDIGRKQCGKLVTKGDFENDESEIGVMSLLGIENGFEKQLEISCIGFVKFVKVVLKFEDFSNEDVLFTLSGFCKPNKKSIDCVKK